MSVYSHSSSPGHNASEFINSPNPKGQHHSHHLQNIAHSSQHSNGFINEYNNLSGGGGHKSSIASISSVYSQSPYHWNRTGGGNNLTNGSGWNTFPIQQPLKVNIFSSNFDCAIKILYNNTLFN